MVDFFTKLPTVLIVGVLVAIFLSLKAHVKSARLRFWVVAWAFIFVHFFVTVFEPKPGNLGNALSAMELGSLLLSGAFFVVSLTLDVDNPKRYTSMLLFLSAPLLTYEIADCFNSYSRALYIVCLLVLYGGGLGIAIYRHRKLDAYMVGLSAIVMVLAAWGLWGAWHGDDSGISDGLNSMLCAIFIVPGIFFWRRFPRWSTGVATTVAGFFAWGSVFPLGTLTDTLWPKLQINPDLWNVPKYFVAFGMILVLLEEKSAATELANLREHDTNLQLQTFADLTTRLLGGVDFNSFCSDVAQAITRVSNFRRASIVLSDEGRRLFIAGHSGISPQALAHLHATLDPERGLWTTETIREICATSRKLGRCSYVLTLQQAQKYECQVSTAIAPETENWKNGNEVMIPLLSARGQHIGCISVDEPKDSSRVTGEDMSTLELLAGDLAVAVENAELHKQLVRSEKLAGIGQLVAGVAHELNNPLTSVIGYSDLIADEELNERSRQRLETLKREAQRMKRIVQNLLRFARQSQPQRKQVDFAASLHEVVALRDYQLRMQGIQLVNKFDPELPLVEVDDDQLKHVLVNVLSNAADAVKSSAEKIITLELSAESGRVILKVSDTGPGFSDLDRALDPFYTTKPIGEGTGLGLSICYGIINSHGGELRISNLKPRGACVMVDLPAVVPVTTEKLAQAAAH